MRENIFLRYLLLFCGLMVFMGCSMSRSAMEKPVSQRIISGEVTAIPEFEASIFDLAAYQSKLDTFVLILDASNSMGDFYRGISKFEIAKVLIDRLNKVIPELEQIAGLRTVGHHDQVSHNLTELFYDMKPYETYGVLTALDMVSKTGSWSPMSNAIYAVKKDLKPFGDKRNAVIFISFGLNMKGTIRSAKSLKKAYGPNICFYPVLVGNAPEGRERMEEIARIGGCGFVTLADDILGSAGMASYVESVFLEKTLLADLTPSPPEAYTEVLWTFNNVLFDFDKFVIKSEASPLLEKVVAVLEKNPSMGVEINGHTDNIGGSEYNMDLSRKRAQAVANFFMGKGIQQNRLVVHGYGFTQPVARNDDRYGRSQNRRVEIKPF